MPKRSAGLLPYRIHDGVVEVLIGHPGGHFWASKDDGAWSILKGEYIDGELQPASQLQLARELQPARELQSARQQPAD